MSDVESRWRARLAARLKLRARARKLVVYWGKRAGSTRGARKLREARALYALRDAQVEKAERVLARHSKVSTVSEKGVAFVASFEGFRSAPYRDAVGVWTIGYGETRGIGPGTKPWTRAYAAKQLRARLNRDYLKPVLDYADNVGLTLSQGEADALASFSYNLGPGVFKPGTSIGNAMRSRNKRAIADAVLLYDKAGGRALAGLTRRRRAERQMFLNG